jgi:nicotinamidase-related amidase
MLESVRPCCIEGSGGEAVCADLEPDVAADYIIKKRRYSAFFGTDLDLVLRENGIENTVIVGTKTNCCIRATVNDAFNYGYNITVLSDCVGTNDAVINDAHLSDFRRYYGEVRESEEWRLASEQLRVKN